MNPCVLLPILVSFVCLVSCNTVSHVDYLDELSRVRNQGSGDDIVGIWQSKAVFNSAIMVSGTIHKTLNVERGGRGIFRAKSQAASGGRPFIEESPVCWDYSGSGLWTCSFQSDQKPCRALLRRAGSRLLMESWFLLDNGLESVRHRDVLDRANSESQQQAMENIKPVQVDWILSGETRD